MRASIDPEDAVPLFAGALLDRLARPLLWKQTPTGVVVEVIHHRGPRVRGLHVLRAGDSLPLGALGGSQSTLTLTKSARRRVLVDVTAAGVCTVWLQDGVTGRVVRGGERLRLPTAKAGKREAVALGPGDAASLHVVDEELFVRVAPAAPLLAEKRESRRVPLLAAAIACVSTGGVAWCLVAGPFHAKAAVDDGARDWRVPAATSSMAPSIEHVWVPPGTRFRTGPLEGRRASLDASPGHIGGGTRTGAAAPLRRALVRAGTVSDEVPRVIVAVDRTGPAVSSTTTAFAQLRSVERCLSLEPDDATPLIGRLVVEAQVAVDGRLRDLRVTSSVPAPRAEACVRDVAAAWRFDEPGRLRLPYFFGSVRALVASRLTTTDARLRALQAVALAVSGQREAARRLMTNLTAPKSGDAELHHLRGLIEQLAQSDAAEGSLRRSLALDDDVEVRFDLVRLLATRGRRSEADGLLHRTLVEHADDVDVLRAAADAQLEALHGDEATRLLERARQLAPLRVDVIVEKARLLAQAGDLRSARTYLAQARTLARADPGVLRDLGLIALRADDDVVAVAALEDAVERDPNSFLARNDLGVARARTHHLPEALIAFRQAGELAETNALPHENEGLAALMLGRADDATRALTIASTFAPRTHSLWMRGEAGIAGNDVAAGLQTERVALHAAPERAARSMAEGAALAREGELGLAIRAYGTAIDADATRADARIALGRGLLLRAEPGDVERTAAVCRTGLARDPTARALRRLLADALVRARRVDEAKAALEEGLALEPRAIELLTALGVVLTDARDLDGASRRFETALHLDRSATEAMVGQARVALLRNDVPRAESRLRAALDVNPRLVGARADLGRLLSERGDQAGALRELTAATTADARSGKAWFYLAFVLDRVGRHDEVEATLRRAVDSQPDLGEAHLELAKLFVAQGRLEDAQAALTAATRVPATAAAAAAELRALDALMGPHSH